MIRSLAGSLLLTLVLSNTTRAQQSSTPAGSLTLGMGTPFGGGIGSSVELYALRGRASFFVGVGVVPAQWLSGLTGDPVVEESSFWHPAGGVRFHFSRAHHRAFLEACAACLVDYFYVVAGSTSGWSIDPGPAVSLGYTFTSRAGLTVRVGAGLGLTSEGDGLRPLAQVGTGYTWYRRRTRPDQR